MQPRQSRHQLHVNSTNRVRMGACWLYGLSMLIRFFLGTAFSCQTAKLLRKHFHSGLFPSQLLFKVWFSSALRFPNLELQVVCWHATFLFLCRHSYLDTYQLGARHIGHT
jgi:hypothetical protein